MSRVLEMVYKVNSRIFYELLVVLSERIAASVE